MRLLYRFPTIMPIVMTVWNALYFTMSVFFEGRVKPNVLKFALLYAGTIIPAARGDMQPFVSVMTMPE